MDTCNSIDPKLRHTHLKVRVQLLGSLSVTQDMSEGYHALSRSENAYGTEGFWLEALKSIQPRAPQ